MNFPRIKKKFMAIGLAGGVAIGAGGIAAAFLTGTGAGTGTVHVASTPTVTVIVNGHITGTLRISHTRHVHLTITNPDGATSLGVASVAVTQPAGCPATSFTVMPAAHAIGTVPATATHLAVTTYAKLPTITFNNLPVTQNACTGTLHFRVFTS